MFEALDRDFLEAKTDRLVAYYHSLNQPRISPPSGGAAGPASAHTMVFQEGGALHVFVGLFFPEANQRVLYRLDSDLAERVPEALAACEAFTGEMGFLMTNTKFRDVAPEQRAEFVRTNPFFYQDLNHFFQALSATEIEVKRQKAELSAARDVEAEFQQTFVQAYVRLIAML